jgi:hypothetical protein
VVAATQEGFDAWEGWVHSRMRLLTKAVANTVDVRPWPKAFRPADDFPGQGPPGAPRCFYFLGLAKKRPPQHYHFSQQLIVPQAKVDLTPSVNEFAHKVKDWTERKPGMDIFVKHVLQKALPAWVKPGALTPAKEVPIAADSKKRGAEHAEDGDAGFDAPAAKRHEVEGGVNGTEVERQEDLVDWTGTGEAGEGDAPYSASKAELVAEGVVEAVQVGGKET